MPQTRKNHSPNLKAKVAVEAIKSQKTAAQIAQMFGVHPTQVGSWKKQALAGLPDVFGNGREQIRQQSDSALSSRAVFSWDASGSGEPAVAWSASPPVTSGADDAIPSGADVAGSPPPFSASAPGVATPSVSVSSSD